MENTVGATIVTKQGTGLENAARCRPTCSNTTANPDTSTETQAAEEDQAESLNNEELLQVHYDLLDDDKYELDSKNLGSMNPIQNVKGNLRKHIQFWREIGTSKFILTVIEEGYKLPFKTIPVAAVLKNNNSAKCHQQFVQEAIAELALTGWVIQSQTTPHVQ